MKTFSGIWNPQKQDKTLQFSENVFWYSKWLELKTGQMLHLS